MGEHAVIRTRARRLRRQAERHRAAYDPSGEVNVPGYLGSLTAFGALVTLGTLAARARGQQLPERYALSDLVLGGVATHKVSRLLSKSSVTSPVRAPFTEFEEAAGSAEHTETPQGDSGVRHTIGELLTCPFCLGQWVGTAYVAGLALAPRAARTWAAVFTVTAVADTGQHVYERLRAD